MISTAFPSFWPFRPRSNQGLDLASEIDACERQLRTHVKIAPQDEQTPLFDDFSSGASTPERRLTEVFGYEPASFSGNAAWDRTFGLDASRSETPSWLDYSYRPVRATSQILYDLVLGLVIALVWVLDRWYWWLSVLLPPALYYTAYKFIMRGLVWLHTLRYIHG